MSEIRRRHIPASIVREVRLAARDRCCLRGHLILEEDLNRAEESDTLHLHHIIHFSDEGPNTEDNLMLVCPSCHAQIHAQPSRYPLEALREAKRHWIRMRELVPSELVFEGETDGYRDRPDLTLLFRVESFNLQFVVRAPSNIRCGDLGRFIGSWILRPLVFYTRTAPFPSVLTKAHIGPVRLALKPHPEAIFSEDALLGEIPQIEEMELISLVDLRTVAAMMEPATILIDVSGSMREVLTLQSVRKELYDLAEANPAATWVAVDTEVRARLTGKDVLERILQLRMSGGTAIAQIVAGHQGTDTIVITDEDGEKQLRGQDFKLKRIGLAKSSGVEWSQLQG